jgi:hypothetical protein
MANGYTYGIIQGNTSAYEYCLRAARGFGFTIMQRDDPAGDPPAYREESDWYQRSYDEAVAEKVRWSDLSEDEKRSEYSDYVYETMANNAERIESAAVNVARIQVVRDKIATLNVPDGLESYFDEINKWLDQTQEWDGKPYTDKVVPYDEWERQQCEYISRSVERAEESLRDEKARVQEQHEYLDKFYAMIEPLKELDDN